MWNVGSSDGAGGASLAKPQGFTGSLRLFLSATALIHKLPDWIGSYAPTPVVTDRYHALVSAAYWGSQQVEFAPMASSLRNCAFIPEWIEALPPPSVDEQEDGLKRDDWCLLLAAAEAFMSLAAEHQAEKEWRLFDLNEILNVIVDPKIGCRIQECPRYIECEGCQALYKERSWARGVGVGPYSGTKAPELRDFTDSATWNALPMTTGDESSDGEENLNKPRITLSDATSVAVQGQTRLDGLNAAAYPPLEGVDSSKSLVSAEVPGGAVGGAGNRPQVGWSPPSPAVAQASPALVGGKVRAGPGSGSGAIPKATTDAWAMQPRGLDARFATMEALLFRTDNHVRHLVESNAVLVAQVGELTAALQAMRNDLAVMGSSNDELRRQLGDLQTQRSTARMPDLAAAVVASRGTLQNAGLVRQDPVAGPSRQQDVVDAVTAPLQGVQSTRVKLPKV